MRWASPCSVDLISHSSMAEPLRHNLEWRRVARTDGQTRFGCGRMRSISDRAPRTHLLGLGGRATGREFSGGPRWLRSSYVAMTRPDDARSAGPTAIERDAHPRSYLEGALNVASRLNNASFTQPLFLRSAQRFFIASDKRFLPFGVMPPRLFLLTPVRRRVPAPLFLVPCCDDPTSATMAPVSRSLSSFKSATILCKSKIRSFASPALLS